MHLVSYGMRAKARAFFHATWVMQFSIVIEGDGNIGICKLIPSCRTLRFLPAHLDRSLIRRY